MSSEGISGTTNAKRHPRIPSLILDSLILVRLEKRRTLKNRIIYLEKLQNTIFYTIYLQKYLLASS